jgi:hypothetical protein
MKLILGLMNTALPRRIVYICGEERKVYIVIWFCLGFFLVRQGRKTQTQIF